MKTLHRFKNYNREPVVVVTKNWKKGIYKKYSGLFEPSLHDEDAIISISEHLLKNEAYNNELFTVIIHEMAHCFFPSCSESEIEEFSSKVVKVLKKFGFVIRRNKNIKIYTQIK